MATINWVGTGLSSIPGLRRLITAGHDVVVWNRTVEKAKAELDDLNADIRTFDLDTLKSTLTAGDLAISMLPGEWHVPIAEACFEKDAHFVSSSYISPEMAALNDHAKAKGLCCVNEVGLDPGIDHLMAHWLVADYRASDAYDANNDLSFISYCGGIPKIQNDFRYKFSWSPLGVLKALTSPSKSIRDFKDYDVARPWDAVSSYEAPLEKTESFEVYPNRNSIPFMQDYNFDPTWNVKTFVRGTLRLNGWAEAWKDIFTEIETLEGAAGDARLKEMSDGFWKAHAYDEGEPDRVVMCVALKAEQGDEAVYHKTYAMDAWGDEKSTAMADLVSITVSMAVESVLAGEIEAGVTPAPGSMELVAKWLDTVDGIVQHLNIVDHTT
ncbi:saccharopine dehydrogenase [Amylibacter sp. SFDW26]|uniref:saccharopine dehydrogenase family protein n=1 Tax=Amylibacter sp. SFDW26 TaxID=2652722 RepID=UPI001261E7F8|nr:saccharopine dehydrogenase family protein [Amylibacter sp. SFDW26]KAB7615782.1 saccharopine dehydrogenase [Amylibacter sp. SFDW26]